MADSDWIATLSPDAQQAIFKDRAQRAEACVNACEGIEDPADLRRQRDELLDLLKASLPWVALAVGRVQDGTIHSDSLRNAAIVRDAIRKLVAEVSGGR
jgi:hypothetical protein